MQAMNTTRGGFEEANIRKLWTGEIVIVTDIPGNNYK